MKQKICSAQQVNYTQVVVKCQILQECLHQNFNMQKLKFQNMEHSNSRTFQGLSRTYSVFKDFQGPGIFFQNSRTFKDFSRTLWTLYLHPWCSGQISLPSLSVGKWVSSSTGQYSLLKIVNHCWRTLWGEGHSAAGWGIGGSVHSFGQWAAANCTALPSANAGQCTTSM